MSKELNVKLAIEKRKNGSPNRGCWKPGASRVYLFPEGESILEHLEARHTRPYNAYRAFLPEVFRRAGIPADTKANWRQKAGCTCPCSPGFVLDIWYGYDVFVTIKQG